MDIINNRTREITAMALDGLYERSKAISANTANALTPGYQRKEVLFEASLRGVIQKENEKEQIKAQNSALYDKKPQMVLGQTPEQISFLNSQTNEGFFIDVETDTQDGFTLDGNNVNLETEMMDEAQNGMKYQTLAKILSGSYKEMSSIIKGQFT